MEKNTALDTLHTTEANYSRAESARDLAAIAARAAGATWTEIGNALGITKQRAQQRYGSAEAQDSITRHAAAIEKGHQEAQHIIAEIEAKVWGAATPEPSKILEADLAGESVTPSIFSDADAPAPAWTPPTGSPLHSYDTRETSDWYEKYGCGECGRNDRPDSCRNCRRRTTGATK